MTEYQRSFPIKKGIFTGESDDQYRQAAGLLLSAKENLNKAKMLQEPYVSDPRWHKKSEEYEAVYKIRKTLKISLMDMDISGAWIKYYEICMITSCLERLDSNKPFFFFNGELPGAGLKAVWHLANTLLAELYPDSFTWVASSLLPTKKNTALQDSYGLFKFYRDNWIMNEKYNGDLTNLNNHQYWKDKLSEKIDVYFSDAAGPVTDYNEQESEHLPIFIGSVLAALQTLKPGGRMIVKYYTMFEALTLSVVCGIASVFEKTFIYKPIGSKRDNSEVYIIGINYTKKNRLINALKKALVDKQPIKLTVPQETLDSIVNAQIILERNQSYKLQLNVKSYADHNEKEVLEIAKKDYDRWMRDNPTMRLTKKMISFSTQK